MSEFVDLDVIVRSALVHSVAIYAPSIPLIITTIASTNPTIISCMCVCVCVCVCVCGKL